MARADSSPAAVKKLMRGMSFNNLLGIRLAELHADGISITCKVRPELMNSAGVLHGGVTATMADAAMGIAIATRLGRVAATTVEMKLNYLRPVSGGKVTARARILKMGSTLCIGRVDLVNDAGELVGVALLTYMLLKSSS